MDILGFTCSLVNSFMASAMGCGSPINLGLFGPFRRWVYARNFRSTKVKKAIAIRIATDKMIVLTRALYIIEDWVLIRGKIPINGL